MRLHSKTKPVDTRETEDEIRPLKREKDQAVSAEDFAKAQDLKGRVQELQDRLGASRGRRQSVAEVTTEDIAEVVSRATGIPVSQLTQEERERLLKHLRPEFVNRIDEIIVFRTLTKEQIADIARLLLERTRRRLRAQDVELEFTQEAVDLVAAEGFDPEFGARPLRRTIQRKVDNELSRMLLEGSLNSGDRVVVGVEDGNLGFEVLEESALVGAESEDEPGE